MLPSGQLVFKNKALQLTFDDAGVLTEIAHTASGTKGQLPKGSHITKDYEFNNFWSEADAVIRLGRMPPVKALVFFPDADTLFGYSIANNTNVCAKRIQDEVAAYKRAWDEEMQQVQGQNHSVETASKIDIQQGLKIISDSKKKETMVSARAKALLSVAQKGRKRTLDLTS